MSPDSCLFVLTTIGGMRDLRAPAGTSGGARYALAAVAVVESTGVVYEGPDLSVAS